MSTAKATRADRFEGLVLVVILLSVGGISAAASFSHVHDWTMRNAPAGTGDWFGWGNAMISDLVPLGVGLEVRRRRRHGMPIGWYPIAIIVAAALLSLAGQLAQATPSPSGWLLSAVPALGFLALTKLVLSRPSAPLMAEPAPHAASPIDEAARAIDEANLPGPLPPIPAALLTTAKALADRHRAATGRDITRDVLCEQLRVSTATASEVLHALREQAPRVNGSGLITAAG